MEAAQTIRDAMARVATLRVEAQSQPHLQAATVAIKRFQAQRFAGTYADLLQSPEFGGAARFFLQELYGDKDYALRDAQFARIAKALQTFFPSQVVATAVSMAQLHALTEELDHQMALAWTDAPPERRAGDPIRYIRAWQDVGRRQDRAQQLDVVLALGCELDRLTRMPGLRMMLRMMRRPANAAGLAALQLFLEAGFDTFASMAGKGSRAQFFLATIKERESAWIARLFSKDIPASETALHACLQKAL